MQLDKIVERYVALRDRKAQMKKDFEESVAEITSAMDRLENAILQTLNEQGVESVRTQFGTAMKIRSTSVTVADKDSFKHWLHNTDQWHLADIRASKTAVEQFREENNDLPPGINYKEAITVGIRRS